MFLSSCKRQMEFFYFDDVEWAFNISSVSTTLDDSPRQGVASTLGKP